MDLKKYNPKAILGFLLTVPNSTMYIKLFNEQFIFHSNNRDVVVVNCKYFCWCSLLLDGLSYVFVNCSRLSLIVLVRRSQGLVGWLIAFLRPFFEASDLQKNFIFRINYIVSAVFSPSLFSLCPSLTHTLFISLAMWGYVWWTTVAVGLAFHRLATCSLTGPSYRAASKRNQHLSAKAHNFESHGEEL